MNKRRISSYIGFLSGFVSSWLLLIPGYAGTVTEASCPLPAYAGWTANESVRYDATTFTTPELIRLNGSPFYLKQPGVERANVVRSAAPSVALCAFKHPATRPEHKSLHRA
jgi:hypothetical protein